MAQNDTNDLLVFHLVHKLTLMNLGAALLLGISGCGGDGDSGPDRYRVSGTVTFDGQPLPSGIIYFEPNAEQNNAGPAGSATIQNGKYDTASAGKGVIGGPHHVRIEGFDGKKTDGRPFGLPLFNEYKTDTDLPKTDSTQDYQVPASAAKGLVIDPNPV